MVFGKRRSFNIKAVYTTRRSSLSIGLKLLYFTEHKCSLMRDCNHSFLFLAKCTKYSRSVKCISCSFILSAFRNWTWCDECQQIICYRFL